MIEGLFKLIGALVENAEKLGTFSAAAVWAFFTLVLIGYIFFDMRDKKKAAESAWSARLEEAKADALMASAIEKLADQIREMRYSLGKGGANV